MKYKIHIYTLKYSSFSANSSEKTFDILERDKNSALSPITFRNKVRIATANYRIWVIFLCYLIVSYLLFASSIGLNLNSK